MKRKVIKGVLLLILFLLSCVYTIKYLNTVNINISDDTLLLLLESSNGMKIENKIINSFVRTISETEIISPLTLIPSKKENTVPIFSEEKNKEIKEINKSPIIYIYNTHQKEKYASTKEVNLNYSVIDASYYLQELLRKKNIYSIVENKSVSDVLSTNNWNYASSYKVSREFLEKAKKDNPSLKFFIDIHRDSVKKSISTVTINGKSYAKVMFLLGLENNNYKQNEEVITLLENYLNKNYKGLSRGIYRKQGKGVNGVYNQDFSKYCFLIEVGGEENTYDEVINTLEVISELIEYIKGVYND
ncbi:MAG: stage II sporulation protein P [Bacilli bacterium]|nr:stage II sporulation protein P [Bacilli bacterium]